MSEIQMILCPNVDINSRLAKVPTDFAHLFLLQTFVALYAVIFYMNFISPAKFSGKFSCCYCCRELSMSNYTTM